MNRVGVLGTGTMGAGIVQLAAQTAHEVVAVDTYINALERAQVYVRENLSRLAKKGAFSKDESEEAYTRVHWTTNPEDFQDTEAVIEAIVEKVEPKKRAFATLDAILPPESYIFTNTSSISITDLASATSRPDKVCGTHFFTPPPVREAVELPRGLLTSDETVEAAESLIRSFGKRPIVVEKDVPGFVANRFLIPIILEACKLLEEGVATKEDIDLLVKKGLGFPIGPFELADFIGLDVALDVNTYIHDETADPYYNPPRILKEMVRAGRLGQKSGEGFYEY